MRRSALALRLVATLIVALAMVRAVFPLDVVPGAVILFVWLALCGALGLASGSRLVLPLLVLPVVGRWYRIATGPEYLSAGESFPLFFQIVFIVAALTMSAAMIEGGIRARRFLLRRLANGRSIPGEAIVSGAFLLVALGAAVLDWQLGPDFLRPPGPVEVRRYSETEIRAMSAGLPYGVYAAPSAEGNPQGALRSVSSPSPSVAPPPVDAFNLIYCDERCRRSSQVQIISEHRDAAFRLRSIGGKPPPADPVTFTLGGITWATEATPSATASPFSASANLGDAYVTVHAPNRATFERVALGLRRIN